MRELTPTDGPRGRIEHSPLPDFCRLPALFALFVVGALTVTVMWLARDNSATGRPIASSMLFVTWLALVIAVALCKLRALLQRLPGHTPYVGVWLLIVLIVLIASTVARWLDGALQMHLIESSMVVFVRDNALIAALLGAAMLRYFYVLAQWQARLAAVSRCAGRGPAGAHPPALPVQQHEYRGRADPGRSGCGRAYGGGSVRTVPRRAGPARHGRWHAGRGAGADRALPGDRTAAPRRAPARAARTG